MEARDLRLGNWVLPANSEVPEKVFRLDADSGSINTWPEELFRPIPLTEEWLLRARFEIRDDEYYKGRFLIENGISEFFNNGMSFRITTDAENSTHAASVKYVHNLQNLFKELTGTELEIK